MINDVPSQRNHGVSTSHTLISKTRDQHLTPKISGSDAQELVDILTQ